MKTAPLKSARAKDPVYIKNLCLERVKFYVDNGDCIGCRPELAVPGKLTVLVFPVSRDFCSVKVNKRRPRAANIQANSCIGLYPAWCVWKKWLWLWPAMPLLNRKDHFRILILNHTRKMEIWFHVLRLNRVGVSTMDTHARDPWVSFDWQHLLHRWIFSWSLFLLQKTQWLPPASAIHY